MMYLSRLAIMAALTAWCNGHKILVTVFLTLGMLVKIVTVIPLAIFLWEMIRAESTVEITNSHTLASTWP